jgi:hypothetical protein
MPNPAIPEFKGPIEGYVVNYLSANYWRVKNNMEYEDMMQEAQVVYLRLVRKYPDIDTPQHFMALFKTSWGNHFVDFTNKETNARALMYENQFQDVEDTMSNFMSSIMGDSNNNGYLLILIKEAPAEVRQVLSLFLNAPSEILDLASKAWKDGGRNQDYGNNMLCKLLGIEPGTDVIGIVQRYFTE